MPSTAPRYLTAQLQQASNVGYRQRLRSSSSAKLDVPRTKHVTIGGRVVFSSTAAHVWNSLPTAVQSSESLDIFRRRLKTRRISRANTGEEGLRETKNNAFGLATEDRRKQCQLRRTKDVCPGQV